MTDKQKPRTHEVSGMVTLPDGHRISVTIMVVPGKVGRCGDGGECSQDPTRVACKYQLLELQYIGKTGKIDSATIKATYDAEDLENAFLKAVRDAEEIVYMPTRLRSVLAALRVLSPLPTPSLEEEERTASQLVGSCCDDVGIVRPEIGPSGLLSYDGGSFVQPAPFGMGGTTKKAPSCWYCGAEIGDITKVRRDGCYALYCPAPKRCMEDDAPRHGHVHDALMRFARYQKAMMDMEATGWSGEPPGEDVFGQREARALDLVVRSNQDGTEGGGVDDKPRGMVFARFPEGNLVAGECSVEYTPERPAWMVCMRDGTVVESEHVGARHGFGGGGGGRSFSGGGGGRSPWYGHGYGYGMPSTWCMRHPMMCAGITTLPYVATSALAATAYPYPYADYYNYPYYSDPMIPTMVSAPQSDTVGNGGKDAMGERRLVLRPMHAYVSRLLTTERTATTPPPHFGDDGGRSWARWWTDLMYEAYSSGAIERVGGDWKKVRWINPYLGVHDFYWIPLTMMADLAMGWSQAKVKT